MGVRRAEAPGPALGFPAIQLALTVIQALVVLACWRIGQSWVVYPGIALVAVAGGLVAVTPRESRATRLAWRLLALGLLLYASSALLLVLATGATGVAGVWPLPATYAYVAAVAAYALEAVALVLMLRIAAPVFRLTAVLDALVVTLGVGAVAVTAFQPVLSGSQGGFAAALTLLAYPAGDILIVCIVLGGLAVLGWPWRSGWGWLAAGFAVFAIFDSLYLLTAVRGIYTGPLVVDMLWPFGAALILRAAGRPALGEREAPVGAQLWALPFAVTAVSLGILAADLLGAAAPAAARWLACGAVFAVFTRMALTFREVSELAETRRQAQHDDLTELPNRRQLYSRLGQQLAGRSETHRLALLLLDLNRFKEVNDALGHGVGDELLREVAQRLAADLDVGPAGGLVARLGGDEFAVLLPGYDRAAAEAAADRIGAILTRPFALDDITLHVDASIGIALCPEHAAERSALLGCADVAMYDAKKQGALFATYVATTHTHDRARLEALDQLRRGLTTGQIVCFFQPKADLATERIVGAEALVRWAHPERGILAPDAFLPLVEQTGLMRLLTEVVLEQALLGCRAWQEAGAELTVAVNLSAANLLDSDLPGHVDQALRRVGLPGRVLRLEITEGVLMADPHRAAETIDQLRELGVAISMDDYGTGYSSLSYLRQLDLDELKLDRSFITDLSLRPRDLAIVSSTVDLAHALDLIVVAEGVESDADWRTLAGLGCDQAQGYHLSRPLPAAEFLALLRSQPVKSYPR